MVLGEAQKDTRRIVKTFRRYFFLFQELVKRDFKLKYKRTVLGMFWSVLSPLLSLLVMRVVFYNFFGRNTPHYTTYLFAGNIVMSYYREATNTGMNSLYANRKILSKINVPKYLFILSKNVSSFINFLLTIGVFFVFCVIDHIDFGFHMVAIVYPVICISMISIGVGMILSAMYIFFRDTQYLYSVFLMLLQYLSAIFYRIDSFSPKVQRMYLLNPVYVMIKYIRLVVIECKIPSPAYHGLCAFYALIFPLIGFIIYRTQNHKFI
ncbi:MAG: ABC transporter permease, partial [Eubacterium sp.]|nr:ABC transporter permease [Eubacterium sp.]